MAWTHSGSSKTRSKMCSWTTRSKPATPSPVIAPVTTASNPDLAGSDPEGPQSRSADHKAHPSGDAGDAGSPAASPSSRRVTSSCWRRRDGYASDQPPDLPTSSARHGIDDLLAGIE